MYSNGNYCDLKVPFFLKGVSYRFEINCQLFLNICITCLQQQPTPPPSPRASASPVTVASFTSATYALTNGTAREPIGTFKLSRKCTQTDIRILTL